MPPFKSTWWSSGNRGKRHGKTMNEGGWLARVSLSKKGITMKLFKRVLGGALILLLVGAAALAVAVSYESPCSKPDPFSATTSRMKAVTSRCYGSPEVLEIEEVQKPVPAADELLVKVRAAAVNPADWHGMRGEPYIVRLSGGFGAPDDISVGVDFAGTVEAVGKNVTRFKSGDEVFGGRGGALAEYVVVREEGAVVLKPENLTFEQAGSVGIAGITALQGLRDRGRIKAGQKVLINGASGGVGTFAVQIAKAFGAEVTGVCSTRNVELVRSLGADHVVDYTKEDFTESSQQYDVIFDNVSTQPVLRMRRVMKPEGILVIVGGVSKDPWIGPLSGVVRAAFVAPFVDQQLGMFIAKLKQPDLQVLSDLMRAGQVTPVIDKQYTFDQTREAMAYLEEGHARGKVVVTLP
jgi:NADPH:quinone reductase-like Zn-dependent oxidoreductase